jgi:transcriptional regulator with XRE-family HTH domain
METIGARVRAARKAKGMSQEALGKAVGHSQSAISQLELAKTVTSRVLVAIAKALDHNPDWLQSGNGSREPYVHDDSNSLNLLEIPPETRAPMRRLFDAIADQKLSETRFKAAVIALLGDGPDG